MVVISKGYDVSKKIGILFVDFVKNVSKVVTFRRNLKMSFSGALYSTLGGSVGFATTLGGSLAARVAPVEGTANTLGHGLSTWGSAGCN